MKTLKKAGLVGKVFAKGAWQTMANSSVVGMSVVVGFNQGMKDGSFERGLKAYAVTQVTMGIGGGIANVIKNAKQIKNADDYVSDKNGNIVTVEIKSN